MGVDGYCNAGTAVGSERVGCVHVRSESLLALSRALVNVMSGDWVNCIKYALNGDVAKCRHS